MGDDDSEEWMCVDAIVAQVRDIAAGVVLDKIVHTKCHTPGTVPVLVAQSPRSQPTSPMLDPALSNKRSLEELSASAEQSHNFDPESPPIKRIKAEPLASPPEVPLFEAEPEVQPEIKAELLELCGSAFEC